MINQNKVLQKQKKKSSYASSFEVTWTALVRRLFYFDSGHTELACAIVMWRLPVNETDEA